jgi:hypothetical protein
MKGSTKSGDFGWMDKKDSRVSRGTNNAMKETRRLLMKIAGAK